MNKSKISYALKEGSILGILLILIKAIPLIISKEPTYSWKEFLSFAAPIYFVGSILAYYFLLWPLKMYLKKRTEEAYQKEIEEDKNKQEHE